MRKILIIFLSILLLGTHCFAKRNIDSLKLELPKAATDVSVWRIAYAIADRYVDKYGYDSAAVYLEKTIVVAKRAGNDSMFMESAGLKGYILSRSRKYDDAARYTDTAIEYARKMNLPQRLMSYLTERANVMLAISDTRNWPVYSSEALAIAQAHNYKAGEASIYHLISSFYSVLHDYSGELEYINKSIAIYDSLKKYPKVAECYGQIAINLSRQKKYQESLRYANLADSMYAVQGLDFDRNQLKILRGTINKNLGNYERAITLYKDCLDSFQKDDYIQMYIYSNLGIAQSLNGAFADAKQSFHTSISLNRTLFKMPVFDVETNKELGRAFFRVKQYDSALYYGRISENAYDKSQVDIETYQECMSLLRDVYEAKGDLVNTSIYARKYEALQDSIFNRTLASNLIAAQARLIVFEKNKELTTLATENELNKVKTQKQTILNISLIIGLLLSGVIVVMAIAAYRRTLRKNKLLSEQKAQLEAQQLALQEQKNVIDAQVVQLASAAKMKSRFLANISHELRTPVTLLNGMLEIMSGKKQGGEVKEKERLNIAYNNSRKLQQMVEEILDLTKLEHNKSQPVYEAIEIAPLLKRIVYAFETLIEKERLVLKFDDAGAAGYHISIDTGKFEKVINNLVYNAVKFNRSGGYVHVTVRPSADKRSIQIDVADSGIGIAATDIPHIFEHFYQGATTGLKADGAGIGLSLVKEFTALMGGSVSVTSKQGVGTTFSLQFDVVEAPAAEVEQPVIDEQQEEAWDRFPARQKLLIVEDNAEMRYYLQDILGEKADIATASNGIEGIAWLQHNTPDLIISDVMMPGMDGREFITQLKNDERYRKIPVITLTALSDKDSELSFLRLGVDDYIVKPFNADELRIRVYNLLVNLAERRAFAQEPVEAGDEEVVSVGSTEAEEFRSKITAYVLSRVNDLNLSVDDLGPELFLSKRQLYRMCKSLTGFAPAQLIKEIRLQRAYELLLKGNIIKLEDVCNRVGYEKPSYFAQQFYERFGKRATDFL